MIIYFTGTENSRLAARFLARELGDDLVDTRPLIKEGKAGKFHSDRPYIIVTPTYSWQAPPLLISFLKKSQLKGDRRVYFVLTCGDDTGNAGGHLASLCRELGLRYMGLWSLVMPENYLALFPVPQEEEAKAICRAALKDLEKTLPYIKAEKPFPEEAVSFLDRIKSSFIHTLFFRFIVKAGPFTVSSACTSCGKCQAVCVLNNIQLPAGRPVWGKSCTHCMACIASCPVRAIEYGKASQGRPQYWCPRGLLEEAHSSGQKD